MQLRLWDWQVDRLRAEERGSGIAILRHAVMRYQRGDFAKCGTICEKNEKDSKSTTKSYTVKQRFPVSDALLRQILEWHWQIPDKVLIAECEKSIKQWDARIGEMFKAYTGVKYVTEE